MKAKDILKILADLSLICANGHAYKASLRQDINEDPANLGKKELYIEFRQYHEGFTDAVDEMDKRITKLIREEPGE